MGKAQQQSEFWSRLPYALALLGLLVILLTGFNSWWQRDRETPAVDVSYRPAGNNDQGIERLQERLQERLRALPNDPSLRVQLGAVYLQKARETGDPSYYSRAEEALRQVVGVESHPRRVKAQAMTVMGAAALGYHQFNEAQEWAQRSLEIDPSYASAYGVLGDAQLELGQYENATRSFQTMIDLKPGLSSYARASRIRELRGDVDGAIEAMRMAVAAGPAKSEATAWAQVQLGNLYFNSGRTEEAMKNYKAALEEFNGYHLALAALGKAYAAQGEYDEAIHLLERAVATIPQPTTLAVLGDLYAKTGKPDKAQSQYDTVEFIAKLASINRQIYNRELSIFYADHGIKLDSALDLAQREIGVRQDIYGYDALAWAWYQNGRLTEAADAITQAMQLGTRDAGIYYHAGMIYHGLKGEATARHYLRKALALNPSFSILHADQARETLQQLEMKLGADPRAGEDVQ